MQLAGLGIFLKTGGCKKPFWLLITTNFLMSSNQHLPYMVDAADGTFGLGNCKGLSPILGAT